MPTIENMIFSKRVSRMLGLGLDSWNSIMLWALGIGAVAALTVVLSQWVIIKLQKLEAQDKAEAFERFKLETGKEIAEANERAQKLRSDNLLLQRSLAARRIAMGGRDGDDEVRKERWKAVEKYAGTLALIQSDSDSEPKILASDIGFALKKSGWNVRFIAEEESHIPPGLFPQGGVSIATLEAPPFFVKKDASDSQPEIVQPPISAAGTAAKAVESLLSLDLGPPLGPMFFGVHWQPEYPGEMAFITKYGFQFPPAAVLIFVGTRPLDAALQPIGVDSPATKTPSP
jgi:hypothetical protein